MSMESAARFWERLAKDEEFLSKVLTARSGMEGLISEGGYEFTIEEFAQVLRSRSLFGVYPPSTRSSFIDSSGLD